MRAGSARIPGLGNYHTLRQWKQNARDLSDGFIAHGAKNKYQLSVFIKCRKRRAKRPCSRGVVRNIQNDFSGALARGYNLKPAWPSCGANTSFNVSRREFETQIIQLFCCGDGQGKIAKLMTATQWRCNHNFLSHDGNPEARIIDSRPDVIRWRDWRHVLYGAHRLRATIDYLSAEHIVNDGMLRQQHDCSIRSQNPSLFVGYFRKRLAQEFLMIKINIRDHAQARFNNVGCVQPAAHANFKYR